MRPADLQAANFSTYPPLARSLAVAHLGVLRQLPLNFLGVLLSELIGYDDRFPVERAALDRQLQRLQDATPAQLATWMAPFAQLPVEDALVREPWVAHPGHFVEQLTAYLWRVHAIDGFREAARRYEAAQPAEAPAVADVPRWCAVVVGRGAEGGCPGLFQHLRPRGTLFTQVEPQGAWKELLRFTEARAALATAPYQHWYVDGAEPSARPEKVCTVSYEALAPVRQQVLRQMHDASTSGVGGPEALRTRMAQLRPTDLQGTADGPRDPVLDSFQLSLLTEGSGTQIFSTTFVQWAGREILRRAQPSTLLMRYAPRQEDRPMNDLLLPSTAPLRNDPEGSLRDANMGAWYTWLGLQHLPGAVHSRFLAWRETGSEAVVIAPGLAQGVLSTQPCTLAQILQWMA